MIKFRCANRSCRFELKARDKKVGKRGVCPSCGLVQTIPQGEDMLEDVDEKAIDKLLHIDDHPDDKPKPTGQTCDLKKCLWCGKMVDARLEKCNHCGKLFERHGLMDDIAPSRPAPQATASRSNVLPLVLAVIVAAAIVVGVVLLVF